MTPLIYGLVDPAEPGHIRYVGMAMRSGRPHAHSKEAEKVGVPLSHRVNWIRKLHREGREYEVLVLEQLSENAPRSFVGFVERCYIKSLRSIGHHLTNQHEGGFGGDPGPEARKKIGDWRRRAKHTQEVKDAIGAKSKGHITSSETRALISEAKKRFYEDPVNRKNNSNAVRDSYTPELREQRRQAAIGHAVTESTRKKLRDAWTDERREANKRRILSDEERARRSASEVKARALRKVPAIKE